jgi:hypothetical protein
MDSEVNIGEIHSADSCVLFAGYSLANEDKDVRKSKLSALAVSSPKADPQLLRNPPTPSNAGRGSLGSARDTSFSVNLASEIYKMDASNQIELCKILWEIRFLQNPEDIEKQLQVIEAAMIAQVSQMFIIYVYVAN